MATEGVCGDEDPLPSVEELVDLEDAIWTTVMKFKAARFQEDAFLVHSVLERAVAAVEARLSAGALDDEAESKKKPDAAAIEESEAGSTVTGRDDAPNKSEDPGPQPPLVIEVLEVGDVVEIIMRKKEFNGREGTVEGVKSGGKKYFVRLVDDGTEKLFKASNVRLKRPKAKPAAAGATEKADEGSNLTQEQPSAKRQKVSLKDMFPSRLAADTG